MSVLIQTARHAAPRSAGDPVTELKKRLEIPIGDDAFIAHLPFAANDVTCGVENELQAVVVGPGADLPKTIRDSNYYRNILKRSRSGDVSHSHLDAIERHLSDNPEDVWENAWVRLPLSSLSPHAVRIFLGDLRADRTDPASPPRQDVHRFRFRDSGEDWIRIPVSYLLKLALADVIGSARKAHPDVERAATSMLDHFLSDNTSPETFSFHPAPLGSGIRAARAITGETLKRHLLTLNLVRYANRKFRLIEHGQRAVVYFASHPPVRQKRLNDIISDGFYRELFMSPCLSGWDRGEEKHRYMGLCHEVLSRSQLNAVKKLQECGIITSNLVVLPNTSNISLANNGTHISIGSRKLTRLARDPDSRFSMRDEKTLGDLVIKITEHFLPLLVGTCTAAPYKLDFADFHPERVLGFLPHELDYTHLRMLWRRWKKKARNRIFGRAATPFGPPAFDRAVSRLFRLHGDLVPDFRLLDYPAVLLSTESSPALDGTLGNQECLLEDLEKLGIFDPRMSLYLLYRMRACHQMGYSGFEGRGYSTFPSLSSDMGLATRLQTLLTALSYQYILEGRITHADIPDTPFIESERRQLFFAAAIDLPTAYIRTDTPNRLMRSLLHHTTRSRASRRYPGFTRVLLSDIRLALIRKIRSDGAPLIENQGAHDVLDELVHRIRDPGKTASATLTKGICTLLGESRAEKIPAATFNGAAETYYRTELARKHETEAVRFLAADLSRAGNWARFRDLRFGHSMHRLLAGQSPTEFIQRRKRAIVEGTLEDAELVTLIRLLVLVIDSDRRQAEEIP